jgi:hypothetical protein
MCGFHEQIKRAEMLFVWMSVPFGCKGSGTCGTEVMQNLFFFLDVCIINAKVTLFISYAVTIKLFHGLS